MRFATDMAEDIVAYPEYEEFIGKLARFHEERGSVFRAEPILGGKKIDLCLLYKLVTERGGMDKVSEERRWRKIGEEFQLPETCTSSAYILKDVYQKYLKDYETVMFPTSSTSIVTSKTSEFPQQSGQDLLSTSTSTNSNSNNVPMQRTTFSGVLNSGVPSSTSRTSYSTTSSPPLPGVKMVPTKLVASDMTVLPSTSMTSSFTSRSSLPRNWTLSEMEEKLKVKAEKSFRASRRQLMCQPRTLLRDNQNKIRLALLSRLQSEIDWGLKKLIALSYVCEEEFAISDIPDLLDALLQCVDEFLWELNDRQSYDPLYCRPNVEGLQFMDSLRDSGEEECVDIGRGHYDLSLLLHNSELVQRILEVVLILRNFSVMEVNKRVILNHTKAKVLIYKCALVQGTPDLEELRMRCMDILESLASYYKLSGPQDILLEILIQYLTSGDRARILTALYILLDLTAHQRNDEALLGCSIGHEPFWKALYTLIVSSDSDLKEMAGEILYRLSQIDESLERHILSGHPLNFDFRRLIEQRSIGWDKTSLIHRDLSPLLPPFSSSTIFSTLSSINSLSNDIWQSWTPKTPTKLSDSIMTPMDPTLTIAKDWLKQSFEEAPNFLVQYPRMYWAYVEAIRGQSHTNSSKNPIMDEKSFLPLLHSLFPDSALQFLRRQNHSEYFISGIRVRQQKI